MKKERLTFSLSENSKVRFVAQHFLLSAKARTLSVRAVARMSEDEASATFRTMRWHANGGDPVCPACGCLAVYEYRTRRLYRCKACVKQFSVTSGTIFHGRKLPMRDYLLAVALFVNAAKGKSALELGRDLDVSYKTAYVLAHKLREAMSAENATGVAKGTVEVDGAYFGGYVKPANHKENRRDRRLAVNQTGKRRVVVVMRERGGRTLPFVVRAEGEAVATIRRRVAPAASSTRTRRDTGMSCTPASRPADQPHAGLLDRRGLHKPGRELLLAAARAEIGQHHHLSGPYLKFYAGEMAWREDNRRWDTGRCGSWPGGGAGAPQEPQLVRLLA
jgi:transposase-like protein